MVVSYEPNFEHKQQRAIASKWRLDSAKWFERHVMHQKTAWSGKTVEDTEKMHETNFVEHEIPHEKGPHDVVLSLTILTARWMTFDGEFEFMGMTIVHGVPFISIDVRVSNIAEY